MIVQDSYVRKGLPMKLLLAVRASSFFMVENKGAETARLLARDHL
jgi:hypothetical protein